MLCGQRDASFRTRLVVAWLEVVGCIGPRLRHILDLDISGYLVDQSCFEFCEFDRVVLLFSRLINVQYIKDLAGVGQYSLVRCRMNPCRGHSIVLPG